MSKQIPHRKRVKHYHQSGEFRELTYSQTRPKQSSAAKPQAPANEHCRWRQMGMKKLVAQLVRFEYRNWCF
jgi:hypothetical protein